MINTYFKEMNRTLHARLADLKDANTVREAREWLSAHQSRLETLFEYPVLLEFVFEPLKNVFHVPGEGEKAAARRVITQVAVTNAVIAGIPGALGIGVAVAISLELWMAYALSRVVGLTLNKDQAIETVLGWAMGAGMVFFGFKQVLNLVFPIVTAAMPFAGLGTAITQLIVTDLFGVLFWIMFEELKTHRKFRLPLRSLMRLTIEMSLLAKHQFSTGISALNLRKWETTGERLLVFLKGDLIEDVPQLKSEIAATVAVAWVLSGEEERLSGPLGEEFIGAIKDRFSAQLGDDATLSEIAEHMSRYDAAEMAGNINMVKGKLFERLVALDENRDPDAWQAILHEDENFPGSDITFENSETGEQIEVSLKATDSTVCLENALKRYPEFPIITTDEVAEAMGDHHMIWAAGMTNEELTTITENNFAQLSAQLKTVDAVDAAAAGVVASAITQLWPYVMSYTRGNISKDKLSEACIRVLPESGKSLASRLTFAAVLGPVFAWWLLARGVMLLSQEQTRRKTSVIRRLICSTS